MKFFTEAAKMLLVSLGLYLCLKALFGFGILNQYIEQITLSACIVVLASLGLNVIYGYTGQFSLGHAAFYGIGAYVSALLTRAFNIDNTFFFLLALLGGGVASGAVAYLIGMPILRLRDDFLGIATLGFAMLVRVLLDNSDKLSGLLGGSRGFVGIHQLSSLEIVFWVVAVFVLFTRNIIHSRYGLFWRSIRDDETAAISIGVNTARMKLTAFTYGCFLAGVAGGLYAHLYSFLHPSNFDILRSIDFLIIVILGGMGSIAGTICAGVLWVGIIEGLRIVLPSTILDYRWVIIPVLLIGLMMWKPEGLMAGRKGKVYE